MDNFNEKKIFNISLRTFIIIAVAITVILLALIAIILSLRSNGEVLPIEEEPIIEPVPATPILEVGQVFASVVSLENGSYRFLIYKLDDEDGIYMHTITGSNSNTFSGTYFIEDDELIITTISIQDSRATSGWRPFDTPVRRYSIVADNQFERVHNEVCMLFVEYSKSPLAERFPDPMYFFTPNEEEEPDYYYEPAPDINPFEDVDPPQENNEPPPIARNYYHGYLIVGMIEIPRTNIRYNILERGSVVALDLAVATMWPNNSIERLNTPGNVVIMGHNYRNGQFFSNNARLSIGDEIIITDARGRRVAYTIYHMFETTPEDTSYITRDTGGATEITLTTCTDCAVRRLIIQARAN